MKVLITHNYYLQLDAKQWAAQKPYPPLATLYAAAAARNAGYDVHFHDVQFEAGPDHFQAVVDEVKPDVVVLYEDGFNYLTKMCLTNMRDAAFTMIGMAKKMSARVLVSGSDSTDHSEEYLAKGADAVIIGEADQTLLEVLDAGKPLEKVAGLVWKNSNKVIRNKPRAVHTSLDDFPKPAWDLLDISPYKNAWKKHGYFSVNVATTRGCPFKCNWCAKPIYGNRYNSHSPQYIVDLIQEMQAQFAFDHIWFCDDIFGLKPGWVQEFSNLMAQDGLRIPFKIQSRADLLVKENTVEALAAAGCDEVWIGAESGSQKVLDAMEKGTTVAQIAEATAMMKKHGIKPCFFLQFGYPGEEWQDIEKTLKMVDDLQPFDIGVSVSYPLPGTKFFENVKEQLGAKANWTDSDELLMMYRGTFSPEFYKKLHRFLHRRFRAAAAKQNFLQTANLKKAAAFFYHKPLELLEKRKVDALLAKEL
jgi:anaerobic magnesium-protoporphyrin IX monomethyl ester cyclase